MEKKTISSSQEFSNEKFTKRVLYKHNESVVFVLNFLPGQELPPHKHPSSEVYLLVLEGSGTITVDGSPVEAVKGEAIHCSGDEEFAYKNTGDAPCSLYVVLNKVPDERYAVNM